MKRQIYLTLAVLALAGVAAAQGGVGAALPVDITASKITVPLSQPPQKVPSAAAVVIGNPGPATYYYWIVSNYLVGSSSPAGPFLAAAAPNTLSLSNYVHVSWAAAPGAISYDLLRTATPGAPSGACNCAVTTAVAGVSASDQSNSLLAYTVNAIDPASLAWTLTNQPSGSGISILSFSAGGAMKLSADSTGDLSAQSIGGVREATAFPGADIGAETNAAIASCPSAGCTVMIPAGQYSFATTIAIRRGIWLRGAGAAATVLDYTGPGDAILVEAGDVGPYRSGGIAHLTISGNASADAVGIHQVNTVGFSYRDLAIENFTGSSGAGLWLDNQAQDYCASCGSGFNERTELNGINFFQNTAGLKGTREGTTSTNSLEYTWGRDLHFQLNNGQVGIDLIGENTEPISLQHSDIDFMANICLSNATGAGATIVSLTDDAQWYQGFVHATAEQSCGTTTGTFWAVDGTSYVDAWGDYVGISPVLVNSVAAGGTLMFGLYQTYVFGQNASGQAGNGGLDTSKITAPLALGGNSNSGVAGYYAVDLPGSWASGGQLNESVEMGGDAGSVAGLGFDFGSNIQHPLSWSYTADPVAFGWYSKLNSTTPISGAPIAWITGDDPTAPYTAHSFAAAGYCFSGNSTCLSEPAASGPAATVFSAMSASIGGSALAAGSCTTGAVAAAGSTTAMAVTVSPAADPGAGFVWEGWISAAGTVTVRVCNITSGSLTPAAETYNVRVIQ